MNTIQIKDKQFKTFISEASISEGSDTGSR